MIKYTQNSLNILAAIRYKGIGKAKIVSYWHKDFSDEAIIELINQFTTGEQTSLSEYNAVRQDIVQRISQIGSYADGLIGWLDEEYPFCRGKVNNSEFPVVLFYKGDISLLDKRHQNISVIGVLNPEESIILREQRMVSYLLKRNYVIVSGLAHGCDSIAHIQTLKENGKTIAILPSTLENITPVQHKELAEQIVQKGGLLITEYFEEPQSQMDRIARYAQCDRLQAMFSDAIILTASYDVNNEGNDNGSRLAMEYARKYHIPRYVMYNETIDNAASQFALNRRILKEGDAKVFTQNCIPVPIQKQQATQPSLF